jgi:hypothetical protein
MNNLNFFKYKLKVIILKDLVLYKEVIKLYYNNLLIKYYKVKKILKFFKKILILKKYKNKYL